MGKAKKATLSEDAIEVLSGLGEVTRLDKDLKKLIRTLNRDEVRCIVNYYYNVCISVANPDSPISILSWNLNTFWKLVATV